MTIALDDLLLLLLSEHGLGLSFSFGLGSRSRQGQGHDRVKVTSLTFDLVTLHLMHLMTPGHDLLLLLIGSGLSLGFGLGSTSRRVKVMTGSRSRVIITMTSIVLRYILTGSRSFGMRCKSVVGIRGKGSFPPRGGAHAVLDKRCEIVNKINHLCL